MERENVYARVTEVFKDVFDDDSIVINDNTTAEDIDDWDSLTHISLLNAIEDEFNIHFDMKAVHNLKNVGAMIDLIIDLAK